MKEDCIFFKKSNENILGYSECSCLGYLQNKNHSEDDMCRNCRLWDAYIPISATDQEKEKALSWQSMSLTKQPDYYEYFANNK